jgi:hypothetical protein
MADVITYGGVQISISAGVPATYDQPGFAALTYSSIGELISFGDRGQTFEDVAYTTLGDRATKHLKGTTDQPETEVEMAVDRSDAGQILMKAAKNSDAEYAFKVAYSNGEIDYFQALVNSFVVVGGDANAIRTATSKIRVNYQDVVEA